jgi:hypothetical protein
VGAPLHDKSEKVTVCPAHIVVALAVKLATGATAEVETPVAIRFAAVNRLFRGLCVAK